MVKPIPFPEKNLKVNNTLEKKLKIIIIKISKFTYEDQEKNKSFRFICKTSEIL